MYLDFKKNYTIMIETWSLNLSYVLWKHQVFTIIVNKPFSVQKCLEIYWGSLLLLIKDISVTSKFLFYDVELYVDELYNNIILYFQFYLTQIHEIITYCLFYEKDLTKNDNKIEQEFHYRRNSCFTILSFTSMSFIILSYYVFSLA